MFTKGLIDMKKAAAVLGACGLVSLLAGALPKAAESAVPAARTVCAATRSYCATAEGSGSLCYLSQSEVTNVMPLVIGRFYVEEGDEVKAGDKIASVDRDATASMIESLGQVSQLAVAAANLSTAVSLIPSEVVADCSGRVISVAGNGAAVESGYCIATLAASDTLALTAAISERDIANVREGQHVTFTLTAYPNEIFTGSVSHIASAARSEYNGAVLETVVDVTVIPDKLDERLCSGLSAQISVQLEEPRQVCVLPYEAIGQDSAGEFVYVYENGEAVRRGIFTGAEFSDGTEVTRGISAGELVFASPEDIDGRGYIKLEE